MADYVVNEVLCVLSNNFGRRAKSDIIMIFSQFYSENEICDAKSILMPIAEKLTPKADELKKIKTRVGDGKSRRDTEDLLLIYELLDVRKSALPRFLAANSHRIPEMKDVDLSKITSGISDLSAKVMEISSLMGDIAGIKLAVDAQTKEISVLMDKVNALPKTLPPVDPLPDVKFTSGINDLSTKVMEISSCMGDIAGIKSSVDAQKIDISAIMDKVNTFSKAAPMMDSCQDVEPMTSTSQSAIPVTQDEFQWSLVGANGKAIKTLPVRPHPPRPSIKRIVGVKTSGTSLAASSSAVSRAAHFFIGKLDKDTSTDDMRTFLNDIGVDVIDISKLKATEEWQKKSSAFRVIVAAKCKDAIFSPDVWPESVEIREWFFKPK